MSVSDYSTESYRNPVMSPPERYLEGYIALRQCFDDSSDYFAVLGLNEAYSLGGDLESAIATKDTTARAALLALPLGGAVISGVHLLKASGEQSLATSYIFSDKLQKLLRHEYHLAAEAVRPDNEDIPPFPFEQKMLIRTLMRGHRSRRAIEQVQRLLATETLRFRLPA